MQQIGRETLVEKLTVVGSGVMGRGIAYVAALGGYQVLINDVSQANLEKAKVYIETEMSKSADRGFLKREEVEMALQNIHYTSSLEEAAGNADVVIEAVFELIELKVEVFKKLDEICPAHTLLATNTSTMSPTEIAAQTSRPEKCIAMHFFNPVHKMKLIEIVRGLQTSDETMNRAREVSRRLGKETVEVNEFPGFVTSRMNCLIGKQ
jgi:3-hydroxybutyryl-CoA dehydrogenase